MPIHDWTRVPDWIFHHFHQEWISSLSRALNAGVLPEGYYALSEQRAVGVGPDVLTLKSPESSHGSGGTTGSSDPSLPVSRGGTSVLLDKPRVALTAEADADFYSRKQNVVGVRDSDSDALVAVIEIVSSGNKSSQSRIKRFIEKAAMLIYDYEIHLLVIDPHPPTLRDPQGIHGAFWDFATGEEYIAPPGKPLTLVSYEADEIVRAYIEPVAVGDRLIDMPLFLSPGAHILVPLEATYDVAFEAVPVRWRDILQTAD